MSLPISYLSCLPDAHKCTIAFLCSPSDPLPLYYTVPQASHKLCLPGFSRVDSFLPEMQQAGLFSLGLLVPTLLDISSLLCFTLFIAVVIVWGDLLYTVRTLFGLLRQNLFPSCERFAVPAVFYTKARSILLGNQLPRMNLKAFKWKAFLLQCMLFERKERQSLLGPWKDWEMVEPKKSYK